MHSLLRLILSILFLVSATITLADTSLKHIEHTLEDSVITATIEARYTNSSNLNPLKIFVSTENGIVTLKGHVKNNDALIDAIRIARTTDGVHGVEVDDLEVKQVNTALTDTYITARVEAAVLKAKILDDESIPLIGINAKTSNGSVTLSGTVKQEKSILAIIKRVSVIHGVKKVVSRLTVSKEA